LLSFDKSVGHFLGWLSEMESNVDNLEFQVESSQDGLQDNLPGALDDIKVRICILLTCISTVSNIVNFIV